MARTAKVRGADSLHVERILLGIPSKIKANKLEDVYDGWSANRYLIGNSLEHVWVKTILSILIMVNVATMVIETDLAVMNNKVPMWLDLFNYACIVTFVVELSLKLYAYRKSFKDDMMNVVDFVIIVADLLGVFVSLLGLNVLSFTVLRTLRFIRTARILRHFTELRELDVMLRGLMSAFRAIAFGTGLIFAMLLMWSILACQVLHPKNLELYHRGVYGDCEDVCELAFSSVTRSFFTLMSTILAGDSWGRMSMPLLMEFPVAGGFIIIPSWISVQLGLVNIVAAVVVDRQAEARLEDEALTQLMHEEHRVRSFDHLRRNFEKMDLDGSGELTMDEVCDSYDNNEEFQNLMQLMDITREDMGLVFQILDLDHSGAVTMPEFVQRIHHLKLTNPHTLACYTQHQAKKILEQTSGMEKVTNDLDARLGNVEELLKTISRDIREGTKSAAGGGGTQSPESTIVKRVEHDDASVDAARKDISIEDVVLRSVLDEPKLAPHVVRMPSPACETCEHENVLLARLPPFEPEFIGSTVLECTPAETLSGERSTMQTAIPRQAVYSFSWCGACPAMQCDIRSGSDQHEDDA